MRINSHFGRVKKKLYLLPRASCLFDIGKAAKNSFTTRPKWRQDALGTRLKNAQVSMLWNAQVVLPSFQHYNHVKKNIENRLSLNLNILARSKNSFSDLRVGSFFLIFFLSYLIRCPTSYERAHNTRLHRQSSGAHNIKHNGQPFLHSEN